MKVILGQALMLPDNCVNLELLKTPILLLPYPCSNVYEQYTDDIHQKNNNNYLPLFLQSIKHLLVGLNLFDLDPKFKKYTFLLKQIYKY